ncbi:ATP-binding protein [Brevibacillus sp. GCM10020057]|uniref:HAMP domain-containing sensor histidine kinase n=1 Tax=Brevibacillus sp. GCM10020057 TaxID=3317327 RepID=UPI00363959CF
MNKNRQTTLFRYWTTRYLITLCVGLLVIGIASSLWINYNETQKRLDFMRLTAGEIADRVLDADGNIKVAPFLFRILDNRQQSLRQNYKPFMLILGAQKQPLFDLPGPLSNELSARAAQLTDAGEDVTEITLSRGEQFLFVKRSITAKEQTVGWVFLFTPKKEMMRSTTEFQLLFIMLISLGLLGWLVIFLLTKKLSQPIMDVAAAAKQIVIGDYDIRLEKDSKETEIYELIHSFKEMADRLRQLEMMRTELLAGVTHELKTPVTSISGLVQAVKDDIVTGAEAKEFLEICTSETARLQKMVEDLLDFNSFAVGDIRIRRESQDVYELVQEITHQWRIGQEEDNLSLHVEKPERPIIVFTDPLRVQQVLYNLLNNAAQASRPGGRIEIRLGETPQDIRIVVQDHGTGIPAAEQPFVFDRFYRGEEKKHTVRGLGLGLSFSRMIAQALGGNLELTESSEAGTTFTLTLRKGVEV